MRRVIIALIIVLSLSTVASAASVTVFAGTAWNAPTPLVIRQGDLDAIRIDAADWETRPLYESPYYSVRFSGQAWALEVIHHKLYLASKHPDVQQFWVSHGYNLILLERLTQRGPWAYRLGGGLVLSHPETIVRNQELSDPPHAGISLTGFYPSGPAAHLSVARHVAVLPWLRLVGEAKLTATWARVPVAGGHADVPNLAIHGLIGIEVAW